jgi:hypothetical protein
VLNRIKQNSWRTNPSVVAGYSIAVFRKANTPTPVVLMGTVITSNKIGHSKIRVSFDDPPDKNDNNKSASGVDKNITTHTPTTSINKSSCVYMDEATASGKNYRDVLSTTSTYLVNSPVRSPTTPRTIGQPMLWSDSQSYSKDIKSETEEVERVIGDVGEPFWLRGHDGCWIEPDNLLEESGVITPDDRIMFWEMVRCIVEMPKLTNHITFPRTVQDIVDIVRRPENRVLWTANGHSCLPTHAVHTLLAIAYAGKDDVADFLTESETLRSDI